MEAQKDAAKAGAVPTVSSWWRAWQVLKGLHNGHLEIPQADLQGKNVLITGGNNGIGREAALQFARWGATSITFGCRQPPPHETHPDVVVEECRAAARAAGRDTLTVEWWPCDMSDLASVEEFANRWLRQDRPLDILVNNAGLPGRLGKARVETKDGFEIIHQVNFLSHTLLTYTVLPSLARAREPRVICTTSNMQYLGTFDLARANTGETAYPDNKLFFQIWLTEFQRRLLQTEVYKHITIQGVHPGCVASGIWAPLMTKGASMMSWPEWSLSLLVKWFAIDTQQGSLAITNAATSCECGPDPSVQGVGKTGGKGGGRFFNRKWEESPMPETQNALSRQQVWDFVITELRLTERDAWRQMSNDFKS